MSRRTAPFRTDVLASRGWFAAVIVVYHLWAIPRGGPVGIDLFFVISGYLITRQLVDERVQTGRVSLVAFAARRIRRIAPVAVVVVVVTMLVAAMLWYLPRAIVVAGDGVSALGLVANWHFIAEQHSYLEPSGTPSPLEHTWSLSVEEQFYLVWPVLVVVATTARSGAGHRRVVTRIVALSLIALAVTATYSAWRTATAPEAAYFDTIARSWEFIPGVIAGALSTTIDRIDERVRTRIGTIGLLVLVAWAILLDPTDAFPWPGAVPAVLGATAFVGFGIHSGWVRRVLVMRPACWLGHISYPLYLWHFPVAVMLPAAIGRSTPVLIGAALVSVLLAAGTSRWLEAPVLRSGWLRRWTTGVHRPAAALLGARRRLRHPIIPALCALVVLALLVSAAAATPSRGTPRPTAAIAALVGDVHTEPPRRWRDEAEVGTAVRAALSAGEWPKVLEPSLDRAFTTTTADHFDEASGCRWNAGTDLAVARPCDDGPPDADRTAWLIGDSTASTWAPALRDALVPLGWRVQTLGFSACSPFDVPDPEVAARPDTDTDETTGGPETTGSLYRPDGTTEMDSTGCTAAREMSMALAAQSDPDLVVLSAAGQTWSERSAKVAPEGRADFLQDWTNAVSDGTAAYERLADRVVVLGPVPHGDHTADCAVRTDGPGRCATTLPTAEVAASCIDGAADSDAGDATLLTDQSAVECIDVSRWFCAADRRCPAFIGDTLVRVDRSHITERTALSFAELLRNALLG